MYNFKINHETKDLEMVKEAMNCHPSIIDKKAFDTIFTREYARFEYFSLLAKIMNCTNTAEDEKKYSLLCDNFTFDKSKNSTDISDVPQELKPIMILTLFAHGKLLKTYEQDNEGTYKIKAEKLTLGLHDFYTTCHKTVIDVENGNITLEDAVQAIKPLYNEATNIINHNAVDGICKKWQESTKEKVTRSFVTGLLSRYKLTRSNRVKAESPLKSQASFEKYFAMWLVTNGTMVNDKKQDKKTVETFASICNRK